MKSHTPWSRPMRKIRSLFYPIVIFVFAQLAWVVVIGLWIYRYVTNNMLFNEVGDRIPARLVSESTNVWALVEGLILMVAVSVAMTLIFRHLTIQLKINKLYDQFIANITHELKSPLGSIQLYLETLISRPVPQKKQKEFIHIMLKDTDRLQNRIDAILDISGLEQKKYAYVFETVTAGPALSQLMEETIRQLHIPPERIRIHGSPHCDCVLDRKAMRTVFDNLVDNAVKYSTGPPSLEMNLSSDSRYVLIELTDKGIGLAPGDQRKLFNKFHRIYRRDIPSVKGTGLGLYWVREIIRAHGGKVSVASPGRNRGSTFTIRLPVYGALKKRYTSRLLKATRKRRKREISHD